MSYKILIVDDNKDFRTELRDILKVYYDVIDVASGEEAIKIIQEPNIIDLVILDEKMPGIQGTEVLKMIKALDPGLFIIMLTGYGQKDIIIEALRGHADDFLEKPVKIENILKSIKILLKKKQFEIKGIINKIKYFIEKNFHKDIKLKEVSELVNLSPKYISRIFKSNTGIGFNAYKLQLKINKARELLDNTDLNINQISYHIGYQNVESFLRIFKRLQGCTPTEYRIKEKIIH